NVSMEKVDRLKALTAHLGIEIQTAGGEAAVLQNDQHALRGQIEIGGKLVGVPPQERIAAVGVHGAEQPLRRRVSQLVHHRVPGQRRVVRLDVQFEMLV